MISLRWPVFGVVTSTSFFTPYIPCFHNFAAFLSWYRSFRTQMQSIRTQIWVDLCPNLSQFIPKFESVCTQVWVSFTGITILMLGMGAYCPWKLWKKKMKLPWHSLVKASISTAGKSLRVCLSKSGPVDFAWDTEFAHFLCVVRHSCIYTKTTIRFIRSLYFSEFYGN